DAAERDGRLDSGGDGRAPTDAKPLRRSPRAADDRVLPRRSAVVAREGRGRRTGPRDAPGRVLRDRAFRARRSVPRRLRLRDERVLAADRVARRRDRRHSRDEQAVAPGPGGLAWLHPCLERDRARPEAFGPGGDADLDPAALGGLEDPGEERRRSQALDPVAVVLEGVVPGQALPASARTSRNGDRAEPIAEAVAHERSRAPGFCGRERAPGTVAPRQIDGVPDRSVVHEDAPPTAPSG